MTIEQRVAELERQNLTLLATLEMAAQAINRHEDAIITIEEFLAIEQPATGEEPRT